MLFDSSQTNHLFGDYSLFSHTNFFKQSLRKSKNDILSDDNSWVIVNVLGTKLVTQEYYDRIVLKVRKYTESEICKMTACEFDELLSIIEALLTDKHGSLLQIKDLREWRKNVKSYRQES